MKKLSFLFAIVLSFGFLNSCKNKEPSVAKIYVRSSSNALVEGAKVIIIGDKGSNPSTFEYVDTVITNNAGYASFFLDPHYDLGGEDYEVAYFDIIVKTNALDVGSGYVRTRIHTTAVETVFLP